VFVGDSYCASFDKDSCSLSTNYRHQWSQNSSIFGHPSLVAAHFNCILHPCGYGGQSWWYSRQKYHQWYLDKFGIDNTLAVIFFHSSPQRINNAHNDKLSKQGYDHIDMKYYYSEIHDTNYYNWSCQQWFKEIAQEHTQVKTIHFHCFPETVKWSDLLPGMIYTTSLTNISIGELTGTNDEVLNKCSTAETRANHLNEHNNQALADVIIHSIENYQPGQQTIDLSKFQQVNPNAHRYPNLKFGTE
jgi:glutamyl/glutaminyl-tRNA synthetase